MGVPPLWCRFLGYGIAAALLGLLGLKWGAIVLGTFMAAFVLFYRWREGHWP